MNLYSKYDRINEVAETPEQKTARILHVIEAEPGTILIYKGASSLWFNMEFVKVGGSNKLVRVSFQEKKQKTFSVKGFITKADDIGLDLLAKMHGEEHIRKDLPF